MEILSILIVGFIGYLWCCADHKPKIASKSIEIKTTVTLSPEVRNVTMAEKKAATPKVTKVSSASKPTQPAPVKTVASKVNHVDVNMSSLVGLTAGVVWRYLDVNGKVSVAKLTKSLEADDKIIQRSIGWLAQEGKIHLETVDRVETIQLKK